MTLVIKFKAVRVYALFQHEADKYRIHTITLMHAVEVSRTSNRDISCKIHFRAFGNAYPYIVKPLSDKGLLRPPMDFNHFQWAFHQ